MVEQSNPSEEKPNSARGTSSSVAGPTACPPGLKESGEKWDEPLTKFD